MGFAKDTERGGRVTCKLVGYDEALATIANLPKSFKAKRLKVLRSFAKTAAEVLRDAIRTNAYGVVENAPRTIQEKQEKGWLLDPLRRTGTYEDNIRAHVVEETGLRVWVTGVDPITSQPYWLIAWRLEYGTAGHRQPARPHWRPFAEWLKGEALPKLAASIVEEALEESARKAGGRLKGSSDVEGASSIKRRSRG